MKMKVKVWERLAPVSDALLRITQAERRIPAVFTRIQLAFLQLVGPSADSNRARLFIRDTLSKTFLAMIAAVALGIAAWDKTLLIACILLSFVLPVLSFAGLNKRILTKKRSIITELPELLNQLVLLVNAGETVQQALIKCGSRIPDEPESASPLDKELQQLLSDLNNQVSLPVGLDNFSKRCGVQEVSLFSNTILLNYRRGGDDFVTSLRELNRGLWDRRKAQAKILGEEASSKLVFPMVMIFLIVTVIVAAPAIFMMGEF